MSQQQAEQEQPSAANAYGQAYAECMAAKGFTRTGKLNGTDRRIGSKPLRPEGPSQRISGNPMNLQAKLARFERFGTDWRRLFGAWGHHAFHRGRTASGTGFFFQSGRDAHARGGVFLAPRRRAGRAGGGSPGMPRRCFRQEQRDFFLHLQNGVLDVIVGGMIAFSVDADPYRLAPLIAAFLMVKGVVRMTLARAMQVPAVENTSTMLGAGVSFLLRLLDLEGMAVPTGGLGPRRQSERRNQSQGMGADDVCVLVEDAEGSAIGGLKTRAMQSITVTPAPKAFPRTLIRAAKLVQ